MTDAIARPEWAAWVAPAIYLGCAYLVWRAGKTLWGVSARQRSRK